MGKETSKRIQTSILNKAEKKALVWLAGKQPGWMNSDIMTGIGVFGALLYMAGGYLSNFNINYLWLASFGLVLHWYGDSLDGTLARVRHTERPVFGFFIDHTLDALTTAMICIGAGLSPIFRMDVALLVLSGYLCLSVYTYICTILKGEFRLTYGSMGPTEFRLLLILLNVVYIYTPLSEWHCSLAGFKLGLFDVIGGVIAIILFLIYIVQLAKDSPVFLAQDAARPKDTEKDKK